MDNKIKKTVALLGALGIAVLGINNMETSVVEEPEYKLVLREGADLSNASPQRLRFLAALATVDYFDLVGEPMCEESVSNELCAEIFLFDPNNEEYTDENRNAFKSFYNQLYEAQQAHIEKKEEPLCPEDQYCI